MALMANVSIAGCVIDEVRIWRAVPLEIGGIPPLRGAEGVIMVNTFERFTSFT